MGKGFERSRLDPERGACVDAHSPEDPASREQRIRPCLARKAMLHRYGTELEQARESYASHND